MPRASLRPLRRLLPALATLWLAGCQSAAAPAPAAAVEGRYQSALAAADAPGRVLTLSLQAGGDCSLIQAWRGRGAFMQKCHWQRQVNLLRLQFPGGESMALAVVPAGLEPVEWREQDWGGGGPGRFLRQ